MKKTLFYMAGILTFVWGVAHLLPTAGVVANFGELSPDNKLIVTMEWIVEGFTLIFLGILTFTVTIGDSESKLARRIYVLIAGMLVALAILSLFTGFRVNYLPFKLCPGIFSASAVLILTGLRLKASETIGEAP